MHWKRRIGHLFNGPISFALSHTFGGKDPTHVVRAFAHGLHSRSDIVRPPFDPRYFAGLLELPIERADITADGLLADWPKRTCRIVLPTLKPRTLSSKQETGRRRRENFTISHEIGHYLIRENLDGLVPRSMFSREYPDEESLCNIFAEEFLMPSYFIWADFRKIGPSPQMAIDLCDVYDVSLTALLCRMAKSLRDDFFAVIWHRAKRGVNIFWATPQRFSAAILCDTGETTVERAFRRTRETEGRDDLLLEGERMRWRCNSLWLGANKVLTLGVRAGNALSWRTPGVRRPAERKLVCDAQMALPLVAG